VSRDAEQYKERSTAKRCIDRILVWRGFSCADPIIWMRSLDPAI
jgi:hypothetical protein